MTFDRVPATLRSYAIPEAVLTETRDVLSMRGEKGLEAVVLWLGRPVTDTDAEILAAYVPEQIAYRSDEGVAVEVTQEGLTALISALPRGVFVLCRVHSHPHGAYHSDTDDRNMLISHPGAISIVVPNFASEPITLSGCSINELHHGAGWRELPAAEVAERFTVV